MNNVFKNNRGFTLVEVLLYVAISTVILGAIVSFLFLVTSNRSEQGVGLEVEEQGRQVSERLTQTIRNAASITSPATGTAVNSTLSLRLANSALDPTVFSLLAGRLYVAEGGGASTSLTNSRVTVSNLWFNNLSKTDSYGSIQFSFLLSASTSGAQSELNYQKYFYGSASLRQ